MKVLVVILALTLTAIQAANERVSYNGFHTLLIETPNGQTVRDVLPSLFDVHEPKRHIISLGDRPPVSYILVAPFLVPKIKRTLDLSGVKYQVLHRNAQEFVDRERQANIKARQEALLQSGGKLPMGAPEYYMDFDQVSTWLDQTATAHSDKAKIEVVGKSYEGKAMKLIKIGSGDKPSIWIDGGIHAREWISISTAVWVIDALLQDTAVAKEMREKYIWYILPVANPDGYQYSYVRERYWRKTRRPTDKDPVNCFGADPNRNWDVAFGTTGVSTDPCSDIWPGDFAFSEPSMKVMSEAVASRPNLRLYVNMHSFMQIILTPYGYESGKYPPDVAELTRVAEAAAKTIQSTHGREFSVGSPPDILYAASGSTMDWVKGKGHAKYTYGPELRPESFIEGGFILPPKPHIRESGEEWFNAFVTMAREMKP